MSCLEPDTNIKDYYSVDGSRISIICDSSYTPCRHFVTDTKTSSSQTNTCETQQMSAFEIFLLLRSCGVVIGHFC